MVLVPPLLSPSFPSPSPFSAAVSVSGGGDGGAR